MDACLVTSRSFLHTMFIIEALVWLLCLYWIHRAAHTFKWMKVFHLDHHKQIAVATPTWRLNNLWLYNDSLKSTIDLWLTEVLPTLVLSLVFGHWHFCVTYYVWAAFFQETFEHKRGLDLFGFTPGDWHLCHHRDATKNFGLFLPVWDIMFGTNQNG